MYVYTRQTSNTIVLGNLSGASESLFACEEGLCKFSDCFQPVFEPESPEGI